MYDQVMHEYWNALGVVDEPCFSTVKNTTNPNYVVKGIVPAGISPNTKVNFWAASPPDRMTTFAGSGLPFPNPEMAFENTPNKGAVRAVGGAFQISVQFPNSFYVNMGKTLLPPHVLVKFCDPRSEVKAIVIGDPIPNRSLTSLPGNYTRSSFEPRQWNEKDLARFSSHIYA